MFEHMLESSHRGDSNKRLNIGFGEEITQAETIEVNFTQLIWSSAVGSSCINFKLSRNINDGSQRPLPA